MYIWLIGVREEFIVGCKRLIGLDGCFFKGILKGLLVEVRRDGNNQIFHIAWTVMEKETNGSWI